MNFVAAAAQNVVDLENISILNAGIVAGLGYAVVFLGLISLMVVITILGKAFMAAENKQKAAPVAPAAPVAAAPVVSAAPAEAPGTAGQLKLHDVPPHTAAMLMAIVANKMGKPLNELRFISIKEVK